MTVEWPPRHRRWKARQGKATTGRWIFVLLVALALAAAVVLLANGLSGDEPESDENVPAQSGAAVAGNEDGGAGSASGSPAASSSQAPAAAVQDFYEAAASGDFAAATGLASPDLLSQLGGEEGLAGTFSTLEAITFEDLQVDSQSETSALVSFSTTAEHTDRTEACSGTASVELVDGAWLVDQLETVNCRPAG